MPSNQASANPNMDGWTKVDPSAANTPQAPMSDPQIPVLYRSSFMHAPMPLMAATGDAFVRQFYAAGNVPQFRTLPAGKGGRP
jgi:hypothetical protein